MRLLLDTHVVLWWLNDNSSLSRIANREIADQSNEVFVSAVSIFEVRLKETIRKITVAPEWWEQLNKQDFELLSFTAEHANSTRNLPLLHRDPFDRMLVAQCQVEDMTLVTRDKEIDAYPIRTIFA